MDVNDWRSVSQTYITNLVHQALPNLQAFDPTCIVLGCDDALRVGCLIKAELGKKDLPILNHELKQVETGNPYLVHVTPWAGALTGQRVLIVDKADNTRASLATFISELRGATKEGAQFGVFVLHNKRRPKTAELPPEILNGRYFVGEEVDNVQIAFPFSVDFHADQPAAHGEHASGAARPRRSSMEHPPRRPSPPPPALQGGMVRAMSSHYVEQILERSVEEQQLVARFGPTMLVAASDGALPAARLLRHYLRFKASARTTLDSSNNGHATDLPVLTPRLELYDENDNPYLAHVTGVRAWGPASLAGQHVLVVDKADSTRSTLAAFISQLQAQAGAARQEAEAQGLPWAGDPLLGVFVLHNKKVDKRADLPPDILTRYFYGEESEAVQIAYPFSISSP